MSPFMFVLAVLTPSVALGASDPALDPLSYGGGAWSPYLVGAGIGVLS